MTVSLFRTLILYVTVICAVRLMGKRQIGELNPAELVIAILISDLAAVPMQDLGIPLLSGVVPIAVLVVLELCSSFLALKSRAFRRLVGGQPAIVIRHGALDPRKMQELRLNSDEIIHALRAQNIASVADVKYGVIEPNGTLDTVLYADKQPPTKADLALPLSDAGLPLIVISKGKIVRSSLQLLHLEADALERRLRNRKLTPDCIFLMTLDDAGNCFIQTEEGKTYA